MDPYPDRPDRFIFLAVKKYTITVKSLPEDTDVEQDPAFDLSSLAVTTGIPDLASEHDHYLYGLPKQRN
jgi:hypothetical protein